MLWQLVLNGVASAGTYALVGAGFGLIYRTARFFHFSHGIVFVIAPYVTYLLAVSVGWPLPVACVLGVLASTCAGCVIEVLVYKPLRRKGASSLVLLLASLGVYVVIQNTISLAFGDGTKSIRPGTVKEGLSIWGGHLSPAQVIAICVSAGLLAAVVGWLRATRFGKALRAVANDPTLALVSGIGSDRVLLWTFAIGSALAGIAGLLVAFDVDMTPTMGMSALMMGAVAVIIGGADRMTGVILGAILLGLAQQIGVWKIGSQWQDAVAFVLLLVFLLFRPQGFLGREIKKATV